VRYLATADDVIASDRVVVTNYERLHHFEPIRPMLGGIVLDESSDLEGARRQDAQAT
jgi:hypothetical protein